MNHPHSSRAQITLKNKRGLHARAASKFARTAKKYAAEVRVTKGDVEVNGKSIMGLMLLSAPKGTDIEITCEGPEAESALNGILDLIKGRFGED